MLLGMLRRMPLRPKEGGFVRCVVRRLMEYAHWYAVLLGMMHCMPLHPKEGRLALWGTRTGTAC